MIGWIADGGFKNKRGELCCEATYKRLVDGDVGPTEGGYYMLSRQDIVPYDEVLYVSLDGYWLCENPDHSIRCFLAPVNERVPHPSEEKDKP